VVVLHIKCGREVKDVTLSDAIKEGIKGKVTSVVHKIDVVNDRKEGWGEGGPPTRWDIVTTQ
jgi:hypothetical protein